MKRGSRYSVEGKYHSIWSLMYFLDVFYEVWSGNGSKPSRMLNWITEKNKNLIKCSKKEKKKKENMEEDFLGFYVQGQLCLNWKLRGIERLEEYTRMCKSFILTHIFQSKVRTQFPGTKGRTFSTEAALGNLGHRTCEKWRWWEKAKVDE